jgi:hypothetical protein
MPWQRWLVERQRSGFSKIQSDAFGLYLQRDAKPTDGSEVTLAEAYSANTQLWALRPTEDETAFVVAASTGNFVLDGTTGDGLRTAPRLRTASGAPWQQWLIVRLPLANEKKPPAED